MGAALEVKINDFLQRKATKFPELAISGRQRNQRTVKYASNLRASGQILLTR